MAQKSAEKSAPPGKPFTGADDPRRGRGPAPGAPNAGRPPDEFKKLMAGLADRAAQALTVSAILDDPSDPLYLAAAKWVAEYGYGKPAQTLQGPDGGPIPVTVVNGPGFRAQTGSEGA